MKKQGGMKLELLPQLGLGILAGVLEVGTGLLIAIFTLQDSFGTACNVTGDGALALILRGLFYKPDGTAKQA